MKFCQAWKIPLKSLSNKNWDQNQTLSIDWRRSTLPPVHLNCLPKLYFSHIFVFVPNSHRHTSLLRSAGTPQPTCLLRFFFVRFSNFNGIYRASLPLSLSGIHRQTVMMTRDGPPPSVFDLFVHFSTHTHSPGDGLFAKPSTIFARKWHRAAVCFRPLGHFVQSHKRVLVEHVLSFVSSSFFELTRSQ